MNYFKSVFFISSVMFSSCSYPDIQEELVLEVLNSENEKIIVAKNSTDATTSTVFSVYVLSNSSNAKRVKILMADNTDGISARWASGNHIIIDMSCGRIFEFRNFADFMYKDFKRIKISLDRVDLCESQK